MANDVSIRVFANAVDAKAEAVVMRNNGFTATVTQATAAANWSNSTVTPPVINDANTPCWVVIGKR